MKKFPTVDNCILRHKPRKPELFLSINLLLGHRGMCHYDSWQGQFGGFRELRSSRRGWRGIALLNAATQGGSKSVAETLEILAGCTAPEDRAHRAQGTPCPAHQTRLGRRLLSRSPRRHVHHCWKKTLISNYFFFLTLMCIISICVLVLKPSW